MNCFLLPGQLWSGYDQSLSILGRHIPFSVLEFKSGDPVFDWMVPKVGEFIKQCLTMRMEMNSFITRKNNLSICSYSVAVKGWFDFSEIQPHVYFNEKLSTAVPYVTSYYSPNWGICLTKNSMISLIKRRNIMLKLIVNFEKRYIKSW